MLLNPEPETIPTITSSTITSETLPEATSPAQIPKPLPTEPYHVHRSASNNLPVYQQAKRGGNLKQTKVQKIDGDVATLREQLQKRLGLDPENIVINPLTRHIVMKVCFTSHAACGVWTRLT
jgi:large subunit ribosomal protein L49